MTASALSDAKMAMKRPKKISQPSALDAQIQDSMQKFWSTITVTQPRSNSSLHLLFKMRALS